MRFVKSYALMIGIALLFVFFIIYLTEAIHPAPQYDQFCGQEFEPRYKTEPIPAGGVATNAEESQRRINRAVNECGSRGGILVNYTYDEDNLFVSADCSLCNKEYEEAAKKHAMIVFYIATIAGVLSLIAGMYVLTGVEAVGLGFMFSGLILIFYGGVQSFRYFGRIARVVLLGLGLLLLIWIAYKKTKKE